MPARQLCLLCFSIYSLILLFRIILNARVDLYGFALAFPGTMIIVSLLVYYLPEWIQKKNGNALFVKALSVAILISFAFAQHQVSDKFYSAKTAAVASGRDLFFDTPVMAARLNQAVKKINSTLKTGDTLLVMPEGVIFNYLTRKTNPLRYATYTPPAIAMWGENELLREFINTRPDYVLLVNRDASEYGYSQFGGDYGTLLMQELQARYRPAWLIGDNPDPAKNAIFIFFERNKRRIESGIN